MSHARTSILLAFVASVSAAVGYRSVTASEEQPPQTQRLAKCAQSAWRVESLTLFGDREVILEKLARHEGSMGVEHNRVFMFIVETGDSADLAMYERTDAERCELSQWGVRSVADLTEQILKQVLASKGTRCAGQLTKALVEEKAGKASTEGKTVPAPKSARDAAGELLKKHPNEFFRLTLLVLC